MEIRRLEDKCNLCMLCVKECVSGVWREKDGQPFIVAQEACNRCSHCLAVCPKNAIIHEALDLDQVRRVKKKKVLPDVYREIIESRRSVRQYKQKPVPKEIIEDILHFARSSPTASNNQNVEYIVVTNPQVIKKVSDKIFGFSLQIYQWIQKPWGRRLLKALEKTSIGTTLNRYVGPMDFFIKQTQEGRDFILHNAPVLILIHTPTRANFACDNCNIAATNIINYAHASGLGTCFIGFITLALRFNKTLRAWLNIPKGRRVFVSLVLGYPAYSHSFTASRKTPKIHWISDQNGTLPNK